MSTDRPRPQRKMGLANGFLADVNAPEPKARRSRTTTAEPIPTPAETPAEEVAAATQPEQGPQPEVQPQTQPPAASPTVGESAADAARPELAHVKIRRTAFLPPELVARVKLATASTGMTYTVLTLVALSECYERGTLTDIITAHRARTAPPAPTSTGLFPDLTSRAPARPKLQFPLHLTAGQLATIDRIKTDLGVDRSFLIEAVLDAYLPHE